MDYKLILEAISAATFVLDTNHEVIAWNKACESLTGMPAEKMLGQNNAGKILYGYDRPCLADIVLDNEIDYIGKLYVAHSQAKLNNGFRAENWHNNIHGQRRYLIVEAAPIYDKHGNLIAAIETLEDATQTKAQEDRLLLSDKVFTYTRQAILITDEKHKIIQCNQAF
jgi:PAS domain-containing protein